MKKQREYWDTLSSHPLDASVIDPNDRLGAKNQYLAGIRNRKILQGISGLARPTVVIDLGCGTGSLSEALSGDGHSVIGMDIARGLLQRTREREFPAPTVFAQFDGQAMPVGDQSVDAVVTYVVLTHVMSDEELATLLSECFRVLKPGALMVCIEQVRAKDRREPTGWKYFRTPERWSRAFADAGLRLKSRRTIRFGRFPLTYLVRAGLWPRSLFGLASAIEGALGRALTTLPGDYGDVLFVLEKPLR